MIQGLKLLLMKAVDEWLKLNFFESLFYETVVDLWMQVRGLCFINVADTCQEILMILIFVSRLIFKILFVYSVSALGNFFFSFGAFTILLYCWFGLDPSDLLGVNIVEIF